MRMILTPGMSTRNALLRAAGRQRCRSNLAQRHRRHEQQARTLAAPSFSPRGIRGADGGRAAVRRGPDCRYLRRNGFAWLASSHSNYDDDTTGATRIGTATVVAASSALFMAGWWYNGSSTTSCEASASAAAPADDTSTAPQRISTRTKDPTILNVATVAEKKFDPLNDLDLLPEYTADDVAANNGVDGKPIWMSYGGVVYDVTDFIPNHPGGSEKILTAAGSAIEPFWFLYRQHYGTDLPMRLMEEMVVGRLRESDQLLVDDQMELLERENDPYLNEPDRHESLLVHSDTPMNAETPIRVLRSNYITPSSLFYIRHHHPVPHMTQDQVDKFKLKVDLSAMMPTNDNDDDDDDDDNDDGNDDKDSFIREYSLDELKSMPKTVVTATLQCSGNRRSGYNHYQRTSGTPWGQGAISTATFGGVLLKDLLQNAGVGDAVKAQKQHNIQHVIMHGADGMMSSINMCKAANPYGDVLVCYEMNGEELPRDHGYPLRMIVPGYAAVRNVKWLEKIELSSEEAEGPWQRGLNYKTLPPSIRDAKHVDLNKMPSMTEASLYSGITNLSRVDSITTTEPSTPTGLGQKPSSGGFYAQQMAEKEAKEREKQQSRPPTRPGDRIQVQVSGWAWAGGGRNIVRVDLTGDEGQSWTTATLLRGADQPFGQAWAWTFWEAVVPAVVHSDGNIYLASKAVDMAFNVQPESPNSTWNVRGLGNNSWHRVQAKVVA